MKISNQSFSKLVTCATLLLALGSCSDGGSGGGGTTSTAQTDVSISGTVSGTRIVAVNASDQIIAQDDTAGRTPNAQGQYAWSLGNLPVGNNIRPFFITGGNVYLMYFGTPITNVFAVNAADSIGLGCVTTAGNQATPVIPPTGVTLGPPNPDVPQSIGAPSGNPSMVTITAPTQSAAVPVGPVTVSFTTQFFPIGTPGQNHLHFYLDTDPTPYMFYNGPSINSGKCRVTTA